MPQETQVEVKEEEGEEKPKKVSCFSCRRKKTQAEECENLAEDCEKERKSCWQRLKCCQKSADNKGCCSRLKKKERWAKRMDSILSEPAPKR